MTENECRRDPIADRRGDELRHRLEMVDEALLGLAATVAAGLVSGDGLERDRCRLVAERIAAKGRRIVDLLCRPPTAGLVAAVAAAPPPAVERPERREQGGEP